MQNFARNLHKGRKTGNQTEYCVLYAQLCPTLRDPMDSSPPDSSLHGISQARILQQVTISFLREFSLAGNQIHVSCISCNGK